MRHVAFAVIVVLLDQSSVVTLPSIERHGVGSVEIGAPAQTIYEMFPRERRELVDLGSEGFLTPALRLTFPGTTQPGGVVAELISGRSGLEVWRIHVSDPAFRTARGIGTGSLVSELRSAYRLDSVLSGEGSVVIRVEELSASFALDQSGPGGGDLRRLRDPAKVPDSVKIISVLLTR